MKCPTCEQQGRPLARTTDKVGGHMFVDLAGQRHNHDPCVYSTMYACENDHHWLVQGKSRCPVGGCTFGTDERPVVTHREHPPAAPETETAQRHAAKLASGHVQRWTPTVGAPTYEYEVDAEGKPTNLLHLWDEPPEFHEHYPALFQAPKDREAELTLDNLRHAPIRKPGA